MSKFAFLFCVLTVFCGNRLKAVALCSGSIDPNTALGQGSGLFYEEDGSCLTSNKMGFWSHIDGLLADEFQFYLDFGDGSRISSMIFTGNGTSHSGFTFVMDEYTPGDDSSSFAAVWWCLDGPDDENNCQHGRGNYTIADCQDCPAGYERQHGDCGTVDTPPADTVCLAACPPSPGSSYIVESSSTCQLCPPGHFQDTAGQNQCIPCPQGTFSEGFGATACTPCERGYFGNREAEYRATCSGKCPVWTYTEEEGLTACKECPFYELLQGVSSLREGLTDVTECPDFLTSGFWQRSGSGSVTAGSVYSSFLSHGIVARHQDRTITVSNKLEEEVYAAMQMGTNFETRSSQGWAAEAGAVSASSPVLSAEFVSDSAAAELVSFAVTSSTMENLAPSVRMSIKNYTTDGCEMRCPPPPGAQFSSVNAWRWIHLVYVANATELVMSVETCNIFCMYDPNNFPQCPAGGRCADEICSVCFAGSFVDEQVDMIASFASETIDPSQSDVGSGTFPPSPAGVEQNGGLSSGAIVGIAAAGTFSMAAVVILVILFNRKQHHSDKPDSSLSQPSPAVENDATNHTGNSDAVQGELLGVPQAKPPQNPVDGQSQVPWASARPVSVEVPDYKDQVRPSPREHDHAVTKSSRSSYTEEHVSFSTTRSKPEFKDQAQTRCDP